MFMGTHQNKVDAKGRVSIPAPFRSAMKELDGRETVRLVLRRSHVHACVEAWPEPMFKALEAPLQTLDMFSQAYDDLASALYIDAHQVESDKEGRVSVPAELAADAGLKDSIMFIGYGKFFLIWEPMAGEAFRRQQRERQKQVRITAPGTLLPGTTLPGTSVVPPTPPAAGAAT